jgi:hypothetical protein
MFKARSTRILSALALTFAAVATVGATSTSADASTPYFPCTLGGFAGICTNVEASLGVFDPYGNLIEDLPENAEVNVQCYYEGGTPDGYWDHIVYGYDNAVQGHIDDSVVNFGGLTPNLVPGLPHCG